MEQLLTNYQLNHKAKFKVGTTVLHLKSNHKYQIGGIAYLESTVEPAYIYKNIDAFKADSKLIDDISWIRSMTEMEDGRFVSCE